MIDDNSIIQIMEDGTVVLLRSEYLHIAPWMKRDGDIVIGRIKNNLDRKDATEIIDYIQSELIRKSK